MAEQLVQAYRAYDGKIFATKIECDKYEVNSLAAKAPMFKIVNTDSDY